MAEEVTIISEHKIDRIRPDGRTETLIAVTYRVEGMLPRTVLLPEREYSDTKLREVIREDLKRAREAKARTLKL